MILLHAQMQAGCTLVGAGAGPGACVPEVASCATLGVPMQGFPATAGCRPNRTRLPTSPIGVTTWVSCATRLGPDAGYWYTWAPNGNWTWGGDTIAGAILTIACSPERRSGT